MKSTIVEVVVMSKKSGHQWGQKGNAIEWDIEMAVPYDQNSIFFKQSGGTNFSLKTINPAAADMFILGEKYLMTLEPVKE